MFTEETLKSIKRWLPKGSYQEIADLAEVSIHTVRKVMSQGKTSARVLKAAIVIAEKYKAQYLAEQERITKLIS